MPNPKLALVLVAGSLIAACFSANKPLDSTQTGNPPVVATDRVALQVTNRDVRVIGEPGAVQPGGAKVEVKNLATGKSFETEAAADGSFEVEVSGSERDAYSVRAKAGGASSSPVFVIRGTAAVGDGRDGSLSCEQRNTLAGELLTQASENADRICAADSDCAPVVARASCYAPGCWYAYVSERGRSQIERVSRDLDANLCADYEADACSHPVPKCAAPPAAACLMGLCAAIAQDEPADPASCNSVALTAGRRFDEAFQAADRTCMVDADCKRAPLRVSCRADCPLTAGFSQAGVDALEAALREIEEKECGEFEALGCQAEAPMCGTSAPDVRCIQNVCTQDAPMRDPDLPDCVVCLENSVQWESSAGAGVTDVSTAGPCASYQRTRIDSVSGDQVDCEAKLVACSAIASTGAISTALAHADVQSVLNDRENPIRLGNTRQGDVFRITIGMRQLELGGSCEGAPPNCIPVPAGVERLREVLQQIDSMLSSPMGPCAGIEN